MNGASAAISQLAQQLTRLSGRAPNAGVWLKARLAASPGSFARVSAPLQAAWLREIAGGREETVWAIGTCHPDSFSTLACGARTRLGTIPVGFGLAELAQQRPAPWHWDLIQLLASAALDSALWQAELGHLTSILVGEYARTLGLFAHDDVDLARRIDLHGLPEALKRRIEDENGTDLGKRQLAHHLRREPGSLRLKPALGVQRQHRNHSSLSDALNQHWAKLQPAAAPICLDLGYVPPGPPGRKSPGDPRCERWLALVQERGGEGGQHHRLIDISALECWSPREQLKRSQRCADPGFAALATAMSPATRAITPGASRDPYLCVVRVAGATYLARTHAPAHSSIHPGRLDRGDAVRLCQIWGQLIANIHAFDPITGGIATPTRLAARAQQARARAGEVAAAAQSLANANRLSYARWMRLAKRKARP